MLNDIPCQWTKIRITNQKFMVSNDNEKNNLYNFIQFCQLFLSRCSLAHVCGDSFVAGIQ